MNKLFILIFLLVLQLNSFSQSSDPSKPLSPYSQGNLGYLGSDFYTKNFSMANVGIAVYDVNSPNLKNPALLSYNKFTVLDVNLGFRNDYYSIDTNRSTYKSGALNSLNLIMPFSYKWTSAFSLTPLSNVSYGAGTTSHILGTVNDSILQYDTATGGLQRISWANGFNIYKGLNLGTSISYSFGNIRQNSYTKILTSSTSDVVNKAISSNYRGVDFQVGGTYHKDITVSKLDSGYVQKKDTFYVVKNNGKAKFYLRKELKSKDIESISDTIIKVGKEKVDQKIRIGLGAVYSTPLSWKQRRISTTNNSFYQILDTTNTSINTPSTIGVGISIGNTSKYNQWNLSFDYEIMSSYDYVDGSISKAIPASSKASLGIQYTPEVYSEKFFKKTTYSVGAYQSKTPYTYNNVQLDEVGIHFGFSFVDKARRSNESFRWREKSTERINAISRYNIGFGVGVLGANESTSIQQAFFKINLGISLNSEWFIRRKIN